MDALKSEKKENIYNIYTFQLDFIWLLNNTKYAEVFGLQQTYRKNCMFYVKGSSSLWTNKKGC